VLKPLYEYVRKLFAVKQQTEKNTSDIKDMQLHLKDLTAEVQRLRNDLERLRDNETHEREKLVLRLENVLLRFERRLPAPPSGGDTHLLE
jgi:hypothetical protein